MFCLTIHFSLTKAFLLEVLSTCLLYINLFHNDIVRLNCMLEYTSVFSIQNRCKATQVQETFPKERKRKIFPGHLIPNMEEDLYLYLFIQCFIYLIFIHFSLRV